MYRSTRRTRLNEHSVAIGEMTQARDLLSSLLATGSASQPLIPGLSQLTQPSLTQSQPQQQLLRATTVTKEAPILPLQAFNAQLVIGGKDKALRKAAELLRTASEGVEQGRARGERYWVDALRIRKMNWGLVPAPLPLGSATGKAQVGPTPLLHGDQCRTPHRYHAAAFRASISDGLGR